jgi:hypothetical protein
MLRLCSVTIIRASSVPLMFLGEPETIVTDFPPPKSYFRPGSVPSVLHVHATYSLINPISRIYHMNISEKGNVCIDILKNNWSPALSIFKVVLSLSSLLTDPNPCMSLLPLYSCIVAHNAHVILLADPLGMYGAIFFSCASKLLISPSAIDCDRIPPQAPYA